jgi:hypothetical protein
MPGTTRCGSAPAALLEKITVSSMREPLTWLYKSIEDLEKSEDPEGLLASLFPAALRRLGREPLCSIPWALGSACGDIDTSAWTMGDAGRACLLLTAIAHSPGWEAMVRRLYRHGDENERAAIIRSLCLSPDPCGLIDLALETGRTNSLSLYAALALDNPFPAACYEQRAFNQIVLKSLFNGLPLARIIRLVDRCNPELSRMCESYRDERTAAGRAVPRDIWLAIAPHASTRGLEILFDALNDEDRSHRYNAILALTRRRSEPQIARALADRLGREPDAQLQGLLASAVA